MWSTRATTIELTGAILVFAGFTSVVSGALVWRNSFEARLVATMVAAYAVTSGTLVVTIGLPAMQPDRDDPVAIISIVGAVVGFVGLALDRRARARHSSRRRY